MVQNKEHLPCRERTFSAQLVSSFEWGYTRRLRWLRFLLERLGGGIEAGDGLKGIGAPADVGSGPGGRDF